MNPDPSTPPQSRLSLGVQAELIPLEQLPDGFYDGEEGGTDVTHEARAMDTLWDVAKKFGVTVADLAAANRLAPTAKIIEGQRLIIPAGKPRYTAERFFRQRPQDYQICVAFLAAGAGLLKIARLLKVHHMTVAAVRDSEGSAIDIQKQRIRRNLRDAIDVGAERLADVMATLPAGQVPVSVAILIDKLAQLEGEPTQRIQVTHSGHLTHDAVNAQLSAFPDAIEVETFPMGFGAGAGSQKALGGAGEAGPGEASGAPGGDGSEPAEEAAG